MDTSETERASLREVELTRYRDHRTPMVFKLVTGEEMHGAIRWFDDRSIRLARTDRSEVTVMLGALAYYRTDDQ